MCRNVKKVFGNREFGMCFLRYFHSYLLQFGEMIAA